MDWRKQMNRLTQMASQGLGRSEKSEGLSATILELEKKLEDVKLVSQKSSNKLSESLLSNAGTDFDKRVRKLPLWSFANTTVEFSSKLNPIFVALAKTMHMVGESEEKLARELIHYEIEVENKVLLTFKNIADRDVPSIQKLRKQLDNYVLDMNSARSRFAKQPSEALRDELDEAKMRVDQAQDQLAAELFSFATREEEFCRLFLTLIEAQSEYHKRSLAILDHLKPSLRQEIDQHVDYPVFKTPLHDHLHYSNREIAFVIEECIKVLSHQALTEEGLFRIAGGKSRVNRLKAAFDANMVHIEEFRNDVHCVADVLKQYLRTLPEPLMTFDLFSEWMSVSQMPADRRLDAIKRILDKLPKANYDNLRYLVKFLALLAEHSEVNKMSPSNLAIVVGPNLLWPKEDRGTNFQVASASIELLITNANWFFPGAIDFSGPESSSTDSSPYMTRRPAVFSHDVPHPSPATVPIATSQISMSPAAASVDLSTLTPSSSSYGDLTTAATVFPDSERLEDTVSLDDMSPKTTRRRRAPAPPVPVISPPESASPPASRPSLASVSASSTPASATLGHRRAASANTPTSAGVMERPNVPPPAPPRPVMKPLVENGAKSAENSRADMLHDGRLDSNAASKVGTDNDLHETVKETASSGDGSGSNGEEKTNRTAELRAQWFQNNVLIQKDDEVKSPGVAGSGTVSAIAKKMLQSQLIVNADVSPRPMKETSRQHSPVAAAQDPRNGAENMHESSAAMSSPAEIVQNISRSAESVESNSSTASSKLPDATGDHRPVPVARPRPQVNTHVTNTGNDLSTASSASHHSNNNQPMDTSSDVHTTKKSTKDTADTSSAPDLPPVSVKRPPPPIVPRQTSRQPSRGESETGKSALEPAVDESQEEEFDTRL